GGSTCKSRQQNQQRENPRSAQRSSFCFQRICTSKKDRHIRAALWFLVHRFSTGCVFHLRGVHIEIGVYVLYVVQVFERLQQPHHLARRTAFEPLIRGCEHRDFAGHSGNGRRANSSQH